MHCETPLSHFFSIRDIISGFQDEEFHIKPLATSCSIGVAGSILPNFRSERHVSVTCLWHAISVVSIGCLLVILGISMITFGKSNLNLDEKDFFSSGYLRILY